MIRRAVDYVANAVRGRQRRAHLLDHAHRAPNGDRLPIGDDEQVTMLIRREWM